MNYSIFWARLLGFYSVILCAWTFLNIKNINTMLLELTTNHAVSMLLGMFTVLLGLAIVVSHSIWRGWPIIVTLVGYWIILKGVVFLLFPQLMNLVIAFWQNKTMILAPVPALLIGIALLYCSYFGEQRVD